MLSESPLIITGMMRSGTTVAVYALRAAGVDLGPQEQLNSNLENTALAAANIELANNLSGGVSFNRMPHPVADDYWYSSDVLKLADDDSRGHGDIISLARAAAAPFEDSPRWGFKHPLHGAYGRFWRSLWPDACWVILYRDPREVATSRAVRGLSATSVYTQWQWYTQRAIAETDGARRVFVSHAAMVSQPVETTLIVLDALGVSPPADEGWKDEVRAYVSSDKVQSGPAAEEPPAATAAFYASLCAGVKDTAALSQHFLVEGALDKAMAALRVELDAKDIH